MTNFIIIEGPSGKREVPESDAAGNSIPFRLEQGERVIGSRPGPGNDIGLGSLIAAITTTTGFKQWWEQQHDGPCLGCHNRQAAYDYIHFKGPEWLRAWVEKSIGKGP